MLLSIILVTSKTSHVATPDFRAIENTQKRKKAFFDYLLPYIAQANNRILTLRYKIILLQNKNHISKKEKRWLAHVAQEYGLNSPSVELDFEPLLKRVDIIPPSLVLAQAANESAWGTSKFARRILTKRGKQLVIMGLEDDSGTLDAVVFSEVFEAAPTPPASGDIICLEGEIGEDNFTGGVRVTATAVYSVAEARARFSKNLSLNLTPENASQFEQLKALLEQYPGRCPVRLKYVNGDAEKIVPLPPRWGVLPEDGLLEALTQLFTSPYDSVRAYLLNLNTNKHYALLRSIRSELRSQNKPLRGDVLATGLVSYSERGEDYIQDIQAMISMNQLEKLEKDDVG